MSSTNVQLVKYQKNGVKVEILAKPGMVTKFRDGKCSLKDALLDDTIYANSSKGEVASDADIVKLGARGNELLDIILKTGKYSLTAQEKREVVEQRRIEVINFLHDNFVDSSTRVPHPIVRIENAIKDIKYNIDPEIDAEHNVRSMIPKLQTLIRLTETSIEGQMIIPNDKLGQCVGICYNMGNVTREEFGPQNAYLNMLISPGKYESMIEQISRASQGTAVFKIAGAAASSENHEETEKTHVKKKGKK